MIRLVPGMWHPRGSCTNRTNTSLNSSQCEMSRCVGFGESLKDGLADGEESEPLDDEMADGEEGGSWSWRGAFSSTREDGGESDDGHPHVPLYGRCRICCTIGIAMSIGAFRTLAISRRSVQISSSSSSQSS
ncbi:unnamed protein product [Prorocentrum cordatum]|uniref:Uncharacterized protein n=1 Tax=Prorocentrum cordatum TaxID=2364126 RepID=A0ABN9R9M9_9DINO|nr:unnamed protein product [Polarella glacialis]CAK0824518.1 unnamed protein product [Polarella glacialis]